MFIFFPFVVCLFQGKAKGFFEPNWKNARPIDLIIQLPHLHLWKFTFLQFTRLHHIITLQLKMPIEYLPSLKNGYFNNHKLLPAKNLVIKEIHEIIPRLN